jgi:hypothetical protein
LPVRRANSRVVHVFFFSLICLFSFKIEKTFIRYIHTTFIHYDIRTPHSFVFVLKGEIVSFFLTHITFKIAIVDKIFLTRRAPNHDKGVTASGT